MAEFTDADRRLIRDVHDALLGTLAAPGGLMGQVRDLAGGLREHAGQDHEDPEVAVGRHLDETPHLDRRNGHSINAGRFTYDVLRNVVTVAIVAGGGWFFGVWMLGWRITLAGTQ